jgi:hypothetical protein
MNRQELKQKLITKLVVKLIVKLVVKLGNQDTQRELFGKRSLSI